MTARESRCDRTRDAALYVLGELGGRQLEVFTRHLRACGECADEVELLQSASDAIPLLAARHVPDLVEEPDRRAPTLAAVAQEQAVAALQEPDSRPDRPVLHAIRGGASGGQFGAGARNSQPGQRSGGRVRLLKSPMPKPAVLGILLLAVIGAITVAMSHQAATLRYVRIKAGWSDGGAAVKLQGNKLELLVEGMPQPAMGNGYQVWVLDSGAKRLTPTRSWLHLNGAGEAGVNVPGDYHDWAAVAVYVEPIKGRQTTKSGAVIVGDLRDQR
jgi:hypothetical protein